MKKFTLISAILFIAATLLAQTPQAFKYQAVARDASGNVLASQNVSFQLSILQGNTVGISVYTETHAAVTNEFGMVNLEIGNGTPVSGNFASINWGADSYFIKTEMDEAGGSNYQLMGTSQLLSVPYALHAKTAEIDGSETKVTAGTNTTVTGSGTIANPYVVNASSIQPDGSETKVTAGTNVTVSGTGTIASPYIINSAGGGGGFTHYVGELFGGGIVVAVWKESGVEHGLIVSLTDVSSGSVWSNVSSTLIGPTAQSPIDGQANTNAILAQYQNGSGAANLCDDFTSGGFSDWYLPALWELNQCYNAAFVVNTILGATNGFQFAIYWSSTEAGNSAAWYQNFPNGSMTNNFKNLSYRVRAVRRF